MNSENLISRNQFLRGRLRGGDTPMRPPWAAAELSFIEDCDGCGDCISACDTKVLVKARGRYPKVDFHQGECTFCKACLDSCQTNALSWSESPWAYKAEISEQCLSKQGVMCRTCGDACYARAITFRFSAGGISTPLVSSETCTGCGACFSPCPVDAIQIKPPSDKRALT